MKLVRVRQLGWGGYVFNDPAFFEYLGQPMNDSQPAMQIKVISARDYRNLVDHKDYGQHPESRLLSAPREHIDELSETMTLALQALVALSGKELVITSEPVSLA
jgi:hypothetical protein